MVVGNRCREAFDKEHKEHTNKNTLLWPNFVCSVFSMFQSFGFDAA
jgi:hypothetical protein